MKKNLPHRELALASVVLAASTLLMTSGSLSASVSAGSYRVQKSSVALDDQRSARQDELKVQLASTHPAEFREALTSLVRLDEPGALDVWREALSNVDPGLRREAWSEYQAVQSELTRKQFVPQIARINAPIEVLLRLAESAGLDVTIWSESATDTVAATPPYLIERLRSSGVDTRVIHNSIAEWQNARASGDEAAKSITPRYQSAGAVSATQMRIAVIELADRTAPAPGYSDWLGDREDILMREGSRIAYLDIFQSDGSLESISAHIAEQYTRRGYKLGGFYTPEEFEGVTPRLFPGKTFNAGRHAKTQTEGEVGIALANGKFHSYDDAQSEFKSLASSHPNLARYKKLGLSYEGREIFALKISKNAAVDDLSKPDVLISGCYHAREWISVESPVYIAKQLLNGYASDDSIKYLVDQLQIWIVPIVNPDGLTYAQQSPNDDLNEIRLWRKNRRPTSVSSCMTSVGVDLNRNYNYQWRTRGDTPCSDYCSEDKTCLNDDMGGSDDPRSEVYRGSEPESEPELKALKSLVDDPNRHFRAQLDYHNYSQLILYPWGYSPFKTDDANTLSRLAEGMSDAMFGVARGRYRHQQAIDLYATTGSSIDYAYGVNRVAAAFLIEMRPNCCGFNVPESDIPTTNQENWAGAKSLMEWTAGPPILESVKAYTPGPDGAFTKLVYSARWSASTDDPGSQRQMIIDNRFPAIEPGRLQVRLQFSKSMSTSLPPRATLGRDDQLDELTLTAVNENGGWQKTLYQHDTWIGETVVIQDQNETSPWRLAVSATDRLGFMLDGMPATRAGYPAGAGRWQGYEDSNGGGNDGGADTQHAISPTGRGGYSNILVVSPNGSERLAAGDNYTVVWTMPNDLGFVPIDQSLLFSTDSATTFVTLAGGIPLNLQRYEITIPRVATTRGRIALALVEPVFHNSFFTPNQADFTVGLNVGSGVDISFVSSEKVDASWSDTSSTDPSSTLSGTSRLIVNLNITNRGSTPILNPFLRVNELSRNVLLTRDPRSRWTVGALQTIDAGSDSALLPGETVAARMVIGLIKAKKFVLSVEMYGVASGGTIEPADAVNVWSGKPKSK